LAPPPRNKILATSLGYDKGGRPLNSWEKSEEEKKEQEEDLLLYFKYTFKDYLL
jgi:hypothetical protein